MVFFNRDESISHSIESVERWDDIFFRYKNGCIRGPKTDP